MTDPTNPAELAQFIAGVQADVRDLAEDTSTPTLRLTEEAVDRPGQAITRAETAEAVHAAADRALAQERAKFRAETLTTSFLAGRLREALGAATRCDRRCQRAKGQCCVTRGDVREWVCLDCLAGGVAAAPLHLHTASVDEGAQP